MPDKIPSKRPEFDMMVKLLNLGSIIFILALLGIGLDHRFQTLPLWTVVGIAAGMAYSFYEAWRIYHQR